MKGTLAALLATALLAGCGKSDEKPAGSEWQGPESVFKDVTGVILRADGKSFWIHSSGNAQKQVLDTLQKFRTLPDSDLEETARLLNTPVVSLRILPPDEYLRLSLATLGPEAENLRTLGEPTARLVEGKNFVSASTPDGKFTLKMTLVQEAGSWRIEDWNVER